MGASAFLPLLTVAALLSPPGNAGTNGLASLHPLHTTLTEVVWDAADGRVTVTLRVFTEDFATAVGRRAHRSIPGGPDATIPDSLALGYLGSRVALEDRAGRSVALTWVGSQKRGDVSFITLSGRLPDGLSGGRISNSVHCEIFEDQVNIVKAQYHGHNESMLFTRGDPPRTLP